METLQFEDALNVLIEQLTKVPHAGSGQALARQTRAQGSDIWIDRVAEDYWRARGHPVNELQQDDKEPLVAAFYDAAYSAQERQCQQAKSPPVNSVNL